MVNIVAQDGGDGHGQQREDGEDGLCRAAHVAHVAVHYQGHNRQAHQAIFQALLLREIACKSADGHQQHDDVLDNGHRLAAPEGARVGRIQRQVALQHVDGIFLEGEDGAVVKHAQQGNQPETKAGENLADVADP